MPPLHRHSREGGNLQPTHWLVIDHYAPRPHGPLFALHTDKILVIDDLADRKHHCNILLDQNLGKTSADYQQLVPEHCALLLGLNMPCCNRNTPSYAPEPLPRQGSIKNILIYFGGSDQHDLTGMATPKPVCSLKAGHSTQRRHGQQLSAPRKAATTRPTHTATSGSTKTSQPCTAYAASRPCYRGRRQHQLGTLLPSLPAIIVTLAENQIPIAQELHQQKLAHWLGNAEDANTPAIQQTLNEVLKDEQGLEDWSQRCFSVTQAQGATALAGYMLLNKDTALHARLANLADENDC